MNILQRIYIHFKIQCDSLMFIQKTVIVNNEIIFFDTYICYKKRKVRMKEQQARKGFRPPSAMKGIGYFQNLRIFLDISGNFLGGYFWMNFFGRNFLGGILCLHC